MATISKETFEFLAQQAVDQERWYLDLGNARTDAMVIGADRVARGRAERWKEANRIAGELGASAGLQSDCLELSKEWEEFERGG